MICSAPFKALHITTSGSFSFCCVGARHHEAALDINDDVLSSWRNEVISGSIPSICEAKCTSQEQLFYTVGQNITTQFPIRDYSREVNTKIDYDQIEYIDARMSNICNFKCIICNPKSSHLIAKDRGMQNPMVSWGSNEPKILDTISKCINLKTLSLAGGEPLFNKALFVKICELVNKSCKLKVITNASVFDEDMTSLMNQFESGKLNCSIDGVGSVIESQRINADWNSIEANMISYANVLHPGWDINLIPTFTSVNIEGLPDLIEWYLKLKSARNSVNFYYTILSDPDKYSIYHMGIGARRSIVDECLRREFPPNKHIESLYAAILMDA